MQMRPGRVDPTPADVDLTRWIRTGDRILWGQGNAEPLSLVQALIDQRHRVGRCKAFIGMHQSGLLRPEHADSIELTSYCGSAANQALADEDALDILPSHYSSLPSLLSVGDRRVDVLMLQLSSPDENGQHSMGLACEYLAAAMKVARVVIAEINDQVPWVGGDTIVHASRIDVAVKVSYPPITAPLVTPSLEQLRIAKLVADLIDDGATLQCGIGAIPEAVLQSLRDRRKLGIHSGVAGDGVANLMSSGAVTNECKGRDHGVGVAGLIMGTRDLHRFVHRNPGLQLRATEYVHHHDVLASLDRLIAINSAIEVDLTGQVNAEVAAGRYVGAMGGAGDFMRGASHSRGGIPIIALPSMAGRRSRIVARLSGPVSTPRCDAGVFVTEHGVVDLRGLTLLERMRCMLEIAHPDAREPLEREAHRLTRSTL